MQTHVAWLKNAETPADSVWVRSDTTAIAVIEKCGNKKYAEGCQFGTHRNQGLQEPIMVMRWELEDRLKISLFWYNFMGARGFLFWNLARNIRNNTL